MPKRTNSASFQWLIYAKGNLLEEYLGEGGDRVETLYWQKTLRFQALA